MPSGALQSKVGVAGLEPVQLGVLDDPGRDNRGWGAVGGHFDVMAWPQLVSIGSADARVAPVGEARGLAFDRLDRGAGRGAAAYGVPART